MFEHIRIVLVETSHPGNIGATARAMKTMGLENLTLVAPKQFPDPEATARASRADDILQQAMVCNTLAEAIADCELIIGTSARSRTLTAPLLEPREGAEKIVSERASTTAIVFGPERVGLNNEQLHHCHFHLTIPVNPDYGSLNLASAVQIICYELRLAHLSGQQAITTDSEPLARGNDMDNLYQHMEKVLSEIDFFKPNQSQHTMLQLKRLFNRQRMERREVNILRGILSAVEKLS